MRFDLTDEQRTLRDEARTFAQEVVRPDADERSRKKEYPADIVDQAAKRGYLGCLVPKDLGGSELGNIGQCLVLEEIAAACPSTHVTLSVHNSLACSAVEKFGSDDLKRDILPSLARGEKIGCYLLTEPSSGSDAAAMKTSAVLDDDEWVLNGDKMWITTGDVADLGVVFARTNLDPDVKDSRAVSAFVVDMKSVGVTCGKREEKLGLRASTTVAVYLEDVRIPVGNLLGERDGGFKIAMELLNGGRIGIAIQAIGIGRAAYEYCIENVGSHYADGRPLAKSQAAQFTLADMATELDAGRLLAWRAADLRDRGRPHITEASMAKLYATQAANRVCREAVALFGETAYDDHHPLARLMRDVRVTELYEGTTEIQRLVIAKQIVPRS